PSRARQVRAAHRRRPAGPSDRARRLAPRFFAQSVSLRSQTDNDVRTRLADPERTPHVGIAFRSVAARVRKSHEAIWNTMKKEGSASVAVVWCRLLTGDKTLLLISGSQVRVLVRPPMRCKGVRAICEE